MLDQSPTSQPLQPRFDARLGFGLGFRLRWRLFQAIEKLGKVDDKDVLGMPTGAPRPALWVFVSTIGELNAIGPFLKKLVAENSALQLVLLSDRRIYSESYLAQHPQADVVEIGTSSNTAFELARVRPPRQFIVAEIPCRPSDAPCRLPVAYLFAAKQAGAIVALVNGWLYGYKPSCKMDVIEKLLLSRESLKIFDVMCVQNTDIAQTLINAGAPKTRVHVTGNIKFDAMDTTPRPLDQTQSPQLLESLKQSPRPIIVAGCVTDDEERDLVLDAFIGLRSIHPSTILILAPRHPENTDVMQSLGAVLEQRNLSYRLRTNSGDTPMQDTESIVVLDTMGELRDFYAIATVAHVGRDHNLLEPLAFGIPVTIRPGWNQTYPSYPVFDLLQRRGVLVEVSTHRALHQAWQEIFEIREQPSPLPRQINSVLESERGASDRCFVALHSALRAPVPPTKTGVPT